MKSHITININYEVKFKLTPAGDAQLKKVNNTYPAYQRYPIEYIKDKDGYYKETLWVLMQIFGSALYNGGPCLFEGNNFLLSEGEFK